MTMPVLFYLVGAAIVPIAFHFISRRDSRLLARDELDHAIETLPRIQRQLRELLELHQAQRARWRKAIQQVSSPARRDHFNPQPY